MFTFDICRHFLQITINRLSVGMTDTIKLIFCGVLHTFYQYALGFHLELGKD